MRVLVEKHETFSHLHKASLGERKKEKKNHQNYDGHRVTTATFTGCLL